MPRKGPSAASTASARGGPRRRAPRGGGGDRRAELERLAREIRACRRCPLGALRTHAVVYRGDDYPRVVFVGEAPGAEEDRQGLPFVGRSGAILGRAVERLEPTLGTWGVLNVLKCHPPENRFLPEAAVACRPFLERQLALLAPERIVSLGARALQSLVPEAPPVLRSAGTARASEFGPVFPLLHPAATLRSRRNAVRWERDLGRLRRWLRDPRR